MKRTTKALSLLLSLCMMLSVFTFTVFAETQSGTCGDNLTWTLDDEGTLTVSGTGDMYDYAYDYANEETPWGLYIDNIKSIKIEKGVTSIGDCSFYRCSSLESIEIPDSVKTIGFHSFSSCTSIKSVTIPNSVTTIGPHAFSYCESLESVVIPVSVTTIDHSAFYFCSSIKSVTIPGPITTIGAGAFGYYIMKGVKYKTPDFTIYGLKGYAAEAYAAEHEFTFVALDEPRSGTCGDNLTWAFDDEGTLTISGTGDMYDYRFEDAPWYSYVNDIKYIVIQDNVKSIGDYAFRAFASLQSITISDSVTRIGNNAFEYCSSLKSVTLPNSVTCIEYSAFFSCTALESIVISNSVTTIEDGAFSVCSALESIIVSEGNIKYHSDNNCLIETESKTLVLGCKNSVIPTDGSVTMIGEKAFYHCTTIESIEIPDSITSIGECSFFNCESLVNITIPNSVTSIGKTAFGLCSSLKTITLSNALTKIDEEMFTSCSSLESITIPDSVVCIGDYSFSGCTSLESITIPNTVTGIGKYAFSNCASLKSVIIPDSVISIEYGSFSGCSSLHRVTIPDSVTSIEDAAFLDCMSLQVVTIPDSVTSIGTTALGHYRDNDASIMRVKNFIVCGVKDSVAETYSVYNGFIFVALVTLPDADSKEYMDKGTLTMPNVVEKTTAVNFIASLSSYGISAKIADKDGVSLTSGGIVGTGCKVTDSNDNVYTVIVRGDVDGTGEVDATDYLQIKQVLLGAYDLTGVYYTASDIDKDGEISSTDYLHIKAHFLGQSNLFN